MKLIAQNYKSGELVLADVPIPSAKPGGVVVRTVVVWHITWSVNSLSHLFGYRNYETDENSKNNWVVALLTVPLMLW